MPCRTDDWGTSKTDRIRDLTKMLCEVCTLVESSGEIEMLSIDTAGWWDRHKQDDEIRRQQELDSIKNRAERMKRDAVKNKIENMSMEELESIAAQLKVAK